MSDDKPVQKHSTIGRAKHFESLCDEFETECSAGNRPSIESFLLRVDGPNKQPLLIELIAIEMHYRRRNGESVAVVEYQTRFPGLSVSRLEETILHSEKAHSQKTPAANQPTIDTRQGQSAQVETNLVKYFGDYELLDVIARGGMGIVYKARQVSLNRIVALKMILSGEFASKVEIDRFYSEAKAAALLDHPGIVPIYEVGEHEGKHFFSMTYVEGSSLASKLNGGPLEPMQAACTMLEVAQAVHYAHEQGVIHRDLKPSNILLDLQGRPRVTDFGLAKRLTEDTGMTVSGDVLGTPSYMPPEQAAGQINTICPASDVYALGAVLYSLTTGRPPFQSASGIETLRQVVEKEPVAPRQLNPAIPRDLETIILKCLEKSLPRRYSTAKLLSEELQRFIEGRPILARPIGRIAKVWRWSRRQPMVASLMAFVFLLLATLAVSSSWAYLRELSLGNDLRISLEKEKRAKEEADAATNVANQETEKANEARKQSQEAERKEQMKSRELARTLYNSDLNRIGEFSQSGNVERIDALLKRQVPKETSDEDLRGMEWYYWWKYAHDEQTQWKLPASIERLSLSSDGKTFVAGCEGGMAYLWDTTSQLRLPQVLDINDKHWSALQFVADQSRIVGVGLQGRRREWNLKSNEITMDRGQLAEDKRREFFVRWPAAIAPDGKTMVGVVNESIASGIAIAIQSLPEDPNPPRWMIELSNGLSYQYLGDRNPSMRLNGFYHTFSRNENGSLSALVDTSKGRKFFANERDPAAPPEEEWGIAAFGLCYSPDGKLVAGGDRDGQIAIYDAATGHLRCKFAGHSALVWSVAFSPDGKMLSTGDANGFIYIWDVSTQKQLRACLGHQGAVRALTFVGHDRLASAGDDTLVRVWDIKSNESPQVLRGHTARVNSLVASGDGQSLFSGGADQTIRVWNIVRELNEVCLKPSRLDDSIESMVVSADESRLLAQKIVWLGGLHLFDLAKKKHLGVLQGSEHTGSPNRRMLSLSPEGHHAIAWDYSSLHLWETETQKKLGEIKFNELERVNGNAIPLQLLNLTWSADGNRFAAGINTLGRSAVWLYELPSLKVIRKVPTEGFQPSAIAFSSDGKRIVVANQSIPVKSGKLLQIFDVNSGDELVNLSNVTGKDWINRLSWSPDGTQIAVAYVGEGTKNNQTPSSVRILNAETLELVEKVYLDAQLKPSIDCMGLRYSADGTQLLVCTPSKRLPVTHVWSTSDKKVTKVWEAGVIDESTSAISSQVLKILLTRNGPCSVTTFNPTDPQSREIRIVDLQSKESLGVLSMPGSPVYGLRLSTDASQVEVVTASVRAGFSGFQERDWRLYSILGEPLQALKAHANMADLSEIGSSPQFGKISPHGLAGMQNGMIDWDSLLQKYPEAAKPFKEDPVRVCYGRRILQCVSFTDDHKFLVTTFDPSYYKNGYSIAWENRGKDGKDFYTPLGCVKLDSQWTVLSPNGKFFAAAIGNEIRILNLSGSTNILLGSHSEKVNRVVWGNDGKWVASSDQAGVVTVWDVSDHRPVATIKNHKGAVHAIVFTNDSRTLFSAGDDEQILGSDPLSGEIKLKLNGHRGSVRDLCFHTDKQLLASAGDDGIVRLWRTANRESVAAMVQLNDVSNSVEDKVITRFRDPSQTENEERIAANNLLKKGCTLSILQNGTQKQFSKDTMTEEQLLDALSKETLHVTGIKAIATQQSAPDGTTNPEAEITDADFEMVSKFPLLATVHIDGYGLTERTLNQFKDHAFLRQLIFRNTKIQEVDLRLFETSTKLEQIDFGQARIIPDSLSACQSMPLLRALYLNGCQVHDHHLSSLSGLVDLRYLSLAKTPITSEGVQYLASLVSLKFLDLSETKVGDAGVAVLSKLPNLERLDLTQTDITMDGAFSWIASRPFLAVTISENLETDRWEDRALLFGYSEDIAMSGRSGIGKFVGGKHLTKLSFSGSFRFSPMRSELTDSQNFTSSGPRSLSELDLQMFENLVHLEELSFGSESFNPSSDQIARILKNKSLKYLMIGCKLDNAGMSTVTQQTSLQTLNFALAGISDQQLVRLSKLPNLTSLVLSKGEFSPDSISGSCAGLRTLKLDSVDLKGDGLKALASLPRLTRLDLNLKEHYSLEQIRDWFPNLRQLRIDDSRIVESEIFSVADQLGKLERLEILNAKLTKASIAEFGKMTGLKHLVLRKTGLDSKAEPELKKLLPKCKVEVKNY